MSDQITYNVDRVAAPAWLLDPELPREAARDFGGQVEWHFATPWVFRALASPDSNQPMLRPPNADDLHAHKLAYWTSLLYLMVYRLGWPRPDRGLRWWYDAGRATDDPTLGLISAVWAEDGSIGHLIQWLSAGNHRDFVEPFEELCGYVETPGDVHFPLGERIEYTYPDGPDQLHLEGGSHLAGGFGRAEEPVTAIYSSPAKRRAVLIYPSMQGWYRALAQYGEDLPTLGDHSWRVDVVVRPVGFLGTYRRSRTTGIWFSGRHSAHVAGT